jgi:hypothetical protein
MLYLRPVKPIQQRMNYENRRLFMPKKGDDIEIDSA